MRVKNAYFDKINEIYDIGELKEMLKRGEISYDEYEERYDEILANEHSRYVEHFRGYSTDYSEWDEDYTEESY